MNIVVTGGAGFIGSHLIQRLLDQNHHVICVDNFFTGQRRNIKPYFTSPNFELIEHDIVEPLYLEDVDSSTALGVNQIYNLACPASPIHYQKNPIRTVKTSTTGMINMLGLAKKTGARILQASTSEVYGDPEVHPQPETYRGNVNPIGPRACYDEGKRVAETLCFDYHREHGLEIRVIRIFNTYGPNMHVGDGRVVSNFIIQALKGEPITIYGDGSHTRSFCYVDDLVEGIMRMMNQASTGPVNLGNPTEFSVKELAEKIIALTGSKSELTYKDLPEDDPVRRQPNISLAKKVLDWSPTTDLESGLQKTIDYFRTVI